MDFTQSNETIPEMNLDHLLVLLGRIDDADRSQRQLLQSSLEELVENILKLQYWEVETGRDYKQWQEIVLTSRDRLNKLIEGSSSLKRYMEQIYPKTYRDAVNSWQTEFYIPKNTPIELKQILQTNYFG